jgi:hypothetical protein
VIISVIIGTYLVSDKKISAATIQIRNFRGIYHYISLLVLLALIMFFYLAKTEITSSAAAGTLSFIFRSIAFHFAIGIIFLSALSIGCFIIERFPVSFDDTTTAFIAIATGLLTITMGLFILGAFGLLYQFVVIPFIIVLIIPGWKKALSLIKQLFFKKTDGFKIHFLGILTYGFILLLVALTLVINTRTFPVGFDSLNLYMNYAKLIAGYHALTLGGDAYNWTLIMSLGFIMYNNATIAILLSVVPGILSLIVIYKISRNLNINRNWSFFACALYYSMPNIIWQSKNDEKTDLGLLFITLCSILLFTSPTIVKKIKEKVTVKKIMSSNPDMALWILCGLLIGFAFGIKYVSMMTVFAFIVVLFYANSGIYGTIGAFFFTLAIIFGLDLPRFAAFVNDQRFLTFVIPFVFSIISFTIAFRKNPTSLLVAVKKAVIFSVTIGITFLPWIIKNISENKSITLNSILTGKAPLPAIYSEVTNDSRKLNGPNGKPLSYVYEKQSSKISLGGFFSSKTNKPTTELLAQLKGTSSEAIATDTSTITSFTNIEKEEEIRRYLGYETGIIRFISLPYDSAMKINVQLGSADIGVIFLILIPILIFAYSFRQVHWNILKIILLLVLLIFSIASLQLLKNNVDYDSILVLIKSNSFFSSTFMGDIFLPVYVSIRQMLVTSAIELNGLYSYLTTQSLGICFVIIIFLSFPLFYVYKKNIQGLKIVSKAFLLFVFCVIYYWLILSSGIIWYGVVGFSLIPVVIVLLAAKIEEDTGKAAYFLKGYILTCGAIWFILILPFQFMPGKFIYSNEETKINFKEFIDPQFARYAIGELDAKGAEKQFFSPTQLNIIKTLNRDKKSRILNAGTFLNYFIVDNDSRVYKDNQLGIFNEMYKRANNDKMRIGREFRKNKIKYVLVSLKTASIDVTPDKSLTTKFDNLMRSMVNNPHFKLLHTNRIVERPDGDMNLTKDGVTVKAKYDVIGKRVLDPGTDALFEIL